tara:strand:+ start:174 stop:446 length:273 start_codon:yes stop_codon:yes gene_type:complete
MCLWRAPDPPDPAPMPQPAPIVARNPGITQQSELPEKKELVNEDDPAAVAYGSSKKDQVTGSKRVGTKALRIPLNTGGSTASAAKGGLNV